MQLLGYFKLLYCNFHTSKKVEARTRDDQQVTDCPWLPVFLRLHEFLQQNDYKRNPMILNIYAYRFCAVWSTAHPSLLTPEIASDLFLFFVNSQHISTDVCIKPKFFQSSLRNSLWLSIDVHVSLYTVTDLHVNMQQFTYRCLFCSAICSVWNKRDHIKWTPTVTLFLNT